MDAEDFRRNEWIWSGWDTSTCFCLKGGLNRQNYVLDPSKGTFIVEVFQVPARSSVPSSPKENERRRPTRDHQSIASDCYVDCKERIRIWRMRSVRNTRVHDIAGTRSKGMVARRSSSGCFRTGVGIVRTKSYRSNPLSWDLKSSWMEAGTEEIQSRSEEVRLEGLTLSAFGVPPVFLIAGWAAGAFKFWTGYRNTTYGDTLMTKATITALWPILFLLSKTFRGNFKRALKG